MTSRIDIGVTGGQPNLLGSLTAAARPLPDNIDWQAFGVDFTPENCGFAWPWQQCTVATDEDPKPLNEGATPVTFKPFLAEYNAASCPGGIANNWAELADRAKRGLSVRTSRVLAQALSSSSPDGSANESPNLPTLATDITPLLGPGELVCTLAGLLQDSVACGLNGEVFIHAPHWTLPTFLSDTLITQIGNVYKLGPHTVVFDQGYSNEAPTASPAAIAGQAWIYVTGPIEYAASSVQVLDDTTRGVTVRENRANVIAAQQAIYRFDPCCVYAALVQVCG